MNEDKERKEDEGLQSSLEGAAKNKKNNRSKFAMIASRLAGIITAIIMPLLQVMLPLIILACVLGGLIYIFDLEGDNNITSKGLESIITNKEYIDIEEAENNQGYYFKIDKETENKYVEEINRAFHDGYWYDTNPDRPRDENYVYNEKDAYIKEKEIAEWFQTEDYKPYLIKMIRAEIASSYPKLGDYEGVDDTESERNKKLGNKKDKDRKLCSTRNSRN